MKTIFNVELIDEEKKCDSSVYDALEDFANHFTKGTNKIFVRDYSNCIEVEAVNEYTGSMFLIFDSAYRYYSNFLSNVNNVIIHWLDNCSLKIQWEYQPLFKKRLNYVDYLTEENTSKVFNIRREFVKSIQRKETNYIYPSREMYQKVFFHFYKMPSLYQLKEKFALPKKDKLIWEGGIRDDIRLEPEKARELSEDAKLIIEKMQGKKLNKETKVQKSLDDFIEI